MINDAKPYPNVTASVMTSEESSIISGTNYQQKTTTGANGSLCNNRTGCMNGHGNVSDQVVDDSLRDHTLEVQRDVETANRNETDPEEIDTIANAFDNKNRHNKNIVIWKDGYIVPLKHASVRIDNEIGQYFTESVGIETEIFSTNSDTESENEEYSVIQGIEQLTEQFTETALVASADRDCQYRTYEANTNTNERPFCPLDNSNLQCKKVQCECSLARTGECKSCVGDADVVETAETFSRQASADVSKNEDQISERSSYSTDSCDEEDGYEIVDWDIAWGHDKVEEPENDDRYDTPPTSLSGDRNDSNSFHSTTSSPVSKTDSFCIISQSCDSSNTGTIASMPENDERNSESLDSFCDIGEATAACGGQSNNAILTRASVTSDTIDLANWDVPASYKTTNRQGHAISHTKYGTHRYSHFHRKRADQTQRLKTPPFINVHAIQYEADPKSGKVRSVGKGSFGQVYKARFFDQRFHHLPIVVKEFGEENTSQPEIIEEAQKLLYLRDTGYVPVCYGLVNLGGEDNPRYGIVQEYVGTGLTLEQLLWEQYDLPTEMWLSIALQCCEGLDLFHKKAILMNDIKSNNVIPEFYQDLVSIKYIDFGLATGMNGKRYKDTKSLEEFVYLAPEVRIHGQTTSVSSDIYSLGFMLDQISSSAWSSELRFVAGLCMKTKPSERTMVSLAANFIRNHMIRLGCDTQCHRKYTEPVSHGYL